MDLRDKSKVFRQRSVWCAMLIGSQNNFNLAAGAKKNQPSLMQNSTSNGFLHLLKLLNNS